MSRNAPQQVNVVVHQNEPHQECVRVSLDGNAAKAVPISRTLIKSFHLTGRKKRGINRSGARIMLPEAHMVIPYWLAADREFI